MEYIKNRKRQNNLNRVKNMRSNGGNLSQNTKIGDISDNMSIKEEENKQEKKNFMKKKVMEDKIQEKKQITAMKKYHSKSVGMFEQQNDEEQ